MSRRSAYLSRVSMYLLSFLGIFVNDSVYLSPSCLLSLSTSSTCVWLTGRLLTLRDGEPSIFSVLPGSEAFSFEHSVSFISVVFCFSLTPGHHSYIFKTYTTSGNLVSLPKRGKIPSNNLGTPGISVAASSLVTGFSLNCVG